MKVVFILLMFVLINQSSFTQKISFNFGTEVNQTRFRQYAPLVTVPFENPHQVGYGLLSFFSVNLRIVDKLSLNLSPVIGFYNTNSKITDAFKLGIYGVRFSPNLKINKINLELGLEFNRLQSLIGTLPNGKKIDWTFFAHRRNLFGPTLKLGYNFFENFNVYFRTTYFLHDFLSSGALDNDGNIVGPVEVTPYIFALGAEFNLSKIVQNSKDGKYRKKK